MLTKQLLQQYEFGAEVELIPKKDGLLLKAGKPHPRSGWEEQFQKAQNEGHQPDKEMLEGFANEFDKKEWTW